MVHCAKEPLYIHQVTTMLATCKNVLFPGHNLPELSGCITTLTVRNTEVANFCAAMDTLIDQDGS